MFQLSDVLSCSIVWEFVNCTKKECRHEQILYFPHNSAEVLCCEVSEQTASCL